MKFELTREQIEEIACCIVDCGLDRDDACDYAFKTVLECNGVEFEDEGELPVIEHK